MLKRSIYVIESMIGAIKSVLVHFTDFPIVPSCQIILGNNGCCGKVAHATIVYLDTNYLITKCKAHFDMEIAFACRYDVFDCPPERWMYDVACKIHLVVRKVPKELIYRIAQSIVDNPLVGVKLINRPDVHRAYCLFYHSVNRYAYQCIILLWKIDMHKDVRRLLARQLWKDRQSWVDLAELPWYHNLD